MNVLNYMNETGISFYNAAAIFNISSPSLVQTWRISFRVYGFDALIPKKKETKKSNLIEGSTKALEDRIKLLEMENAYLKS